MGIPNKFLCYVTKWEFPLENINIIALCYANCIQRPYFIEMMQSYTLPMQCLSGLHLSLLTGGTAVCGHS